MKGKMKAEALKQGYKSLREDMQDMLKNDGLSSFKELNPKKLMKVTVAAQDEKGLEKGLSKAEQILKSKMGDMPEMEHPLESEDKEEYACPMCSDEGCEECPEEDKEEMSEMGMEKAEPSIEELKAKLAALEAKLSKFEK